MIHPAVLDNTLGLGNQENEESHNYTKSLRVMQWLGRMKIPPGQVSSKPVNILTTCKQLILLNLSTVLKFLTGHMMNEFNIVTFFGTLETNCGTALVFEHLDMDLHDYIRNHHPLFTSDIRSIIQQV